VSEIQPNQCFNGHVLFNLSCDAEIGQSHYMTAQLNYENPCQITNGDRLTFECRENIGSYDPNDKQIYVDGVLNADIIDEESVVEYLIRFQNTGTDTAFTVRIEDQLAPYFDPDELIPVVASHDYSYEINRQKLVVLFENILLVDSLTNEKDSHGFVKFRVKLKEDELSPGSIVSNKAEIYFDFNEPIVTNTEETYYLCQHTIETIATSICPDDEYEGYSASGIYIDEFVTSLGCDSLRILELSILPFDDSQCLSNINKLNELQVNVYPIPVDDMLQVENNSKLEITKYEIIDVHGRKIKSAEVEGSFQIQTSDLPTNLYTLILMSGEESVYQRKVVVAR